MNVLKGNIEKIYFKYLAASFGGAILQSVYGLVDMAVVGQYHGPSGSATMAIIASIMNVIYSFGLMTGIGASILFSIEKSSNRNNNNTANSYFTVGLILTLFISFILWMSIVFFDTEILLLLGADETMLPLAKDYLIPFKFGTPVFLCMQFMAAFLRNDNNPTLTTKAIVVGGVFNIVGDILFVFTFDMGILGAGLATVLGASLSLLIMLTHLLSTKNTLRLVRPINIFNQTKNIVTLGFSTFFVDLSMGILTMLFNIQIMKYLGGNALAVYGIIVNISTFVQCCAYGVGQASQPILSVNFGANKWHRIKKLLRYNIMTTSLISLVWLVVTMLFPNVFVHAFMTPSAEILEIAPAIMKVYCISFAFLPFNIYSTYYFQSIMKARIAFVISVSRGLIISGVLIMVLPMLFEPSSIWLAMPISEAIIFTFAAMAMRLPDKRGNQ